ncbi:MAG: ribulose-phosphate 3-epimerase [Bacteroidales bacterium]|nr:ribulose-phosphate 3-epimerase [Bacteroidales bacterium]
MVKIAPSLLSVDFLELGRCLESVNAEADLFHLDIMDGVFVPNISFGFPVVEAIARGSAKPLDAHLMIVEPLKYVERFAKAGVKMLSFHFETVTEPAEAARAVRDCGMSPGLAFNPDVPIEDVLPHLEHFDFAVLMSVFAGFGGQKFIEESYDRLSALQTGIEARGLNCVIEVDGGVSAENCAELARCGADILVAGNAVFKSPDPSATISLLRLKCAE